MNTRKNPFAFLIPTNRKPRSLDYMDALLSMPWREKRRVWRQVLKWTAMWAWEYTKDAWMLFKITRTELLTRELWTYKHLRWLLVDLWQAWRRGADVAMLNAHIVSILNHPEQIVSSYVETHPNG